MHAFCVVSCCLTTGVRSQSNDSFLANQQPNQFFLVVLEAAPPPWGGLQLVQNLPVEFSCGPCGEVGPAGGPAQSAAFFFFFAPNLPNLPIFLPIRFLGNKITKIVFKTSFHMDVKVPVFSWWVEKTKKQEREGVCMGAGGIDISNPHFPQFPTIILQFLPVCVYAFFSNELENWRCNEFQPFQEL